MPYLSLPNFNYDSGPRRIQSGPDHEGYVVLYSGVQSTGPDEGIVVAGAPLSGTLALGAWDYDANWRYVPSTLPSQSGVLNPTPYNVSGALDTYDATRISTRNTVAGAQIASAIGPETGSTVNRPEKYMYFGGAAPDNQNYSPYNTPDANSAAEGKTGGGVTHKTFESSLLTNVLGSQGTSDRSQWRYHQPVYCKTYTETKRSEVPGLMSTPLRAVYRGESTSYNYNYGGQLLANRGGFGQLPPPPPPGGGPAISLRVDPSVVYENEGISLVYYFELSEPLGFVTTSYYLVSGTATNSVDYTGPSGAGSVTIAPGTLSTSFIVTPINDAIYELPETVIVSISGTFCNGASIPASPGSATGVILDPRLKVSVSVAPASVTEAGGIDLIYTFTLNYSYGFDTTVNYSLSGTATYGVDYTGPPQTGSVTILANSLSAFITISPVPDVIIEGSETVITTITSATTTGAVVEIAGPSATGIITDSTFTPLPAGNWRKVLAGAVVVTSDATYCDSFRTPSGPLCPPVGSTLPWGFAGSFTPNTTVNIVAVGPVTPATTSDDGVCGAGPGGSTELQVTVLLANGAYQTLGGVFVPSGPRGRSTTSASCFGFAYSNTVDWYNGVYAVQNLAPIPATYFFPPISPGGPTP